MNIYKMLALASICLLCSCFFSHKTVVYCGKEYLEKTTKVYLTDEGVEATVMKVIDKKTKKIVFGYFISAMRNDTNFIYSKVLVDRDTIMRIDYHQYKIARGFDSSVAKFLCTEKGISLYSFRAYKDGVVVKTENF